MSATYSSVKGVADVFSLNMARCVGCPKPEGSRLGGFKNSECSNDQGHQNTQGQGDLTHKTHDLIGFMNHQRHNQEHQDNGDFIKEAKPHMTLDAQAGMTLSK